MGLLHERIKHELKVMASARSAMKRSEERLALLVNDLLKTTDGTPPLPDPEEPMDEADRQRILKRLRKVGYVLKKQ